LDATEASTQNARGTDAKAALLRLLRTHLEKGTRPGDVVGPPWANEEFVEAVKKVLPSVNKTAKDRSKAPNLRTVQAWRERGAKSLPQKGFLEPIIWALFGENGRHTAPAEELRTLHRQAGYKPPKLHAATSPPAIVDQKPSVGTVPVWEVIGESHSRPLADMAILPPPLSNQPDTTVGLRVRVSPGWEEIPVYGQIVKFAVTETTITPSWSPGCNAETCLGEPGAERDGVHFAGGVWHLSVPLAAEQIASVVFTPDSEPSVTLELSSLHRQLEVTLPGERLARDKKREKLIQVLCQGKLATANGTGIVLARSTLRRRKT
jgi:hypothetical protein